MIIFLLKNPWPTGGIPRLFHDHSHFSMTFQAWKNPLVNSMSGNRAEDTQRHVV